MASYCFLKSGENANIWILKSFPWARGCCVHVFLVIMVFLSFSQPFAKLENVFWDNIIQFKILCPGCPQKTSSISLFLVRIKSDEACVEFRETDIKTSGDAILPCHIFSNGSYPDGMVGRFFHFYKTLLWKVVTIQTRAQNM